MIIGAKNLGLEPVIRPEMVDGTVPHPIWEESKEMFLNAVIPNIFAIVHSAE